MHELFRITNTTRDSIRVAAGCPNLRDLGADAYRIDKLILSEAVDVPTPPLSGSMNHVRGEAVRGYREALAEMQARIVHYLVRVEVLYAEIPAVEDLEVPELDDPFAGVELADELIPYHLTAAGMAR